MAKKIILKPTARPRQATGALKPKHAPPARYTFAFIHPAAPVPRGLSSFGAALDLSGRYRTRVLLGLLIYFSLPVACAFIFVAREKICRYWTRYVYAQFVGPDVLGMGAGQFGYLISYSAVTSLLTNVFFVVCAGMPLPGEMHVS